MSLRHALLASLFAIALAVPATPVGAADRPVPIESFAKLPEFSEVILSPNGRYVATAVPREDQTGIAVLDLESDKVISAKNFAGGLHVFGLRWASDDRLIGLIAHRTGAVAAPITYGEMFAVDADGDKLTYLLGYQGRSSLGGGTSTAFYGFSSVIDPLPDDENYALIATRTFGQDAYMKAQRIHLVSGQRRQVAGAPVAGPGIFLADSNGEVRYFSTSGDDAFDVETYIRGVDERDFRRAEGLNESEIVPLVITPDNQSVYVAAGGDGGRNCLYKQSLADGSAREVACDAVSSLSHLAVGSDGHQPIRAYFEPGKVVAVNVAPDVAEAKLIEAISKRFGDARVRPTSWSADGNRLVFEVTSDRNPGAYYLFDRKAKQARYLLSARSWIDPERMAERRPISFEARDGTMLHGYLTLPPGEADKNLPLVVLPHGGPMGVRDQWFWDPDAQLLASRGYAVLQVNFRGSGGYGSDYLQAGRREWGGRLIDDINDGTLWAIKNKIADADRICAFGASYGAYASLMSAVRYPDLYQCVVGYAGVYNLVTMVENTDIARSRSGVQYMSDYIGKTREDLAEQSPINRLDALKAPVLIVHGKADERTPFSEAKQLRAALAARNHPHEWMARDKEGHGFFALDNRVAFYDTLLGFLDRHIGS